MSYYFNDKNRNKVYSDVIPGANKIKQVYRYKTLLDPKRKIGSAWASPTLFIKDGSVPIFMGVPTTNNSVLSSYRWSYMPIASFTISSLSSRYLITEASDNFGTYYIPFDTIPEMYRYEIFKTDNNSFKPIITDVDYNKGGRISWRISEENLHYFNYTDRGPSDNYYITIDREVTIPGGTYKILLYFCGMDDTPTTPSAIWSSLESDKITIANVISLNYYLEAINNDPQVTETPITNGIGQNITNNCDRMNLNYNSTAKTLFGADNFFTDSNSTITLNSNHGYFIKSKPYYNETLNKFNFNFSPEKDYAPPHFTLSISDIKANYNKLHIQMDGLYLYANNSWNNTAQFLPEYQNEMINNTASFGSDTYEPGTYGYCQALFYAIDNDEEWTQSTITTGVDGDYIGNGRIYSNLTANKNYRNSVDSWSDHKPVASDKDYSFSQTAYNAKIGPETHYIDTDINVFKHFALKYVTDANKCYTTGSKQEGAAHGQCVTAESGVCDNFASHNVYVDNKRVCTETCPYCNGNPQITNNVWYVKCEDNRITKSFISKIYKATNNNLGNVAICHRDYNLYGIKVPVTANFGGGQTRSGYWIPDVDSFYSTGRGIVCNGNGVGYILSGVNIEQYWYQHNEAVLEEGWNRGEWEYNRKPGNVTVYTPRKTSQTAVCPTCNGNKKIKCYCYSANPTELDRLILGPNNEHYNNAAGKLKHAGCDGTGIVYPYTTNTLLYRFKFYGKTNPNTDIGSNVPNKFEGFATHDVVSAFTASDSIMHGGTPQTSSFSSYIEISYDTPNWEEAAIAASTGNISGCFSYKDTTPDDFVDYRQELLGSTALHGGKLLNETDTWLTGVKWNYKNWLIMEDNTCRNDEYYYPHTTNYTPGHVGITTNTAAHFNIAWSTGTYDTFGNSMEYLKTQSISTADFVEFKKTGFAPSAGSNFSFTQVKLDYTIDLTNETRDYLHIALPYVTVFNDYTHSPYASLIPQMIMTYEGTN